MSSVDSVSSLTGEAHTQAAKRSQLGQEDFIELMIAQMRNQDPLKPADPTQFLSQLAQFSQVTGIQSMERAVTGLAESLRSAQLLSGTSLVGREVLAVSDSATLVEDGAIAGAVDVPDGAASLRVLVRDSTGQLVRTLNLEPRAGLTEFTWDGTTDRGTVASPGEYRFEVVAASGSTSFSLQPLLASRVDSVTFDPSSQRLVLNTSGGTFALNDVRRVK